MTPLDPAERLALLILSASTFTRDAPNLAALRWHAMNQQQDAAGAFLSYAGIIAHENDGVWKLTAAAIERLALERPSGEG